MKLRLAYILVLLTVLSGCGYVQSPSSRNARGLDDDLEGLSDSAKHFATTVHPLLEAHCSGCHSALQAPFFAFADNVQESHDAVVEGSLVNFDGVSTSRLVTKLEEVHNCWSSSCENDADVMLQSIQDWASLRAPDENPSRPSTTTKTIPTSVAVNPCPVDGNEVPVDMIEFSLEDVSGNMPNNSVLQIRICQFDDFSYQISDPLIITDEILSVVGVHIHINGIEARPGNSFTQIDRLVDISEEGDRLYEHVGLPGDPGFTPLNVLVGVGLGLPEEGGRPGGGPGTDTIHFEFDSIDLF